MSIEQIQSLVDALASRLRRAVVVDDQDLRLIAVSEDFGDAARCSPSTPRCCGSRSAWKTATSSSPTWTTPWPANRPVAGGAPSRPRLRGNAARNCAGTFPRFCQHASLSCRAASYLPAEIQVNGL
jgi:hypothetical protein